MKSKWNPFLIIGIIGIFTCGSPFATKYVQAIWGDPDIWWTPTSMALPLDQTKNHVAILLQGVSFDRHIDQGRLTVTDDRGATYRLTSGDITVRVNNWHKIRASRLHWAVYFALALGSCATFFGIGVGQWIAYAKRSTRTAGTAAPPIHDNPREDG